MASQMTWAFEEASFYKKLWKDGIKDKKATL